MVVATAIAGSVTFNPETDTIPGPDGTPFKFEAPFGKELPPKGFDPGEDTFQVNYLTILGLDGIVTWEYEGMGWDRCVDFSTLFSSIRRKICKLLPEAQPSAVWA